MGRGATIAGLALAGKDLVDLVAQAHSEEGVRILPRNNQVVDQNIRVPAEFGLEPFYLTQRFNITIAHRAANTKEGIEEAAKAGFSYADGDILKTNKGLFLSHDDEVEILKHKPKLFGIPLIGLNNDTGHARVLKNPPSLDRTAHTAQINGIGLSLELNHGKFIESDLQKVIQIQRKYGINMMVHSWNLDAIQNGKQQERAYDTNGKAITWLVVPSFKTWKDAIRMAQESNNSGVVTNFPSAQERKTELQGTTVILGDVETLGDVQNAAGLKVTSGVMGKRENLARFMPS